MSAPPSKALLSFRVVGSCPARCPEGCRCIFREKISGVKANRPQLAKAMATLTAGDTLIVTKLDRLGRSTRELLELIDRIGKAGAAFRSLGDPLWDTSSSQGRLPDASQRLDSRVTALSGSAGCCR